MARACLSAASCVIRGQIWLKKGFYPRMTQMAADKKVAERPPICIKSCVFNGARFTRLPLGVVSVTSRSAGIAASDRNTVPGGRPSRVQGSFIPCWRSPHTLSSRHGIICWKQWHARDRHHWRREKQPRGRRTTMSRHNENCWYHTSPGDSYAKPG